MSDENKLPVKSTARKMFEGTLGVALITCFVYLCIRDYKAWYKYYEYYLPRIEKELEKRKAVEEFEKANSHKTKFQRDTIQYVGAK